MQAGNKFLLSLLLALGLCNGAPAEAGQLIVVAHEDTPALDVDTLQKIYLGKVIEIGGRPVVPINLLKGNVLRTAFMQQVMAQEDDKFIAYWTVRRYIGRGSPPREFVTVQEQLEFMRKTPGAVGYSDESPETKQGLKTLFRKP